ncbi:MAG: twin-arginine translocase subunit TatC [Pseudomonadota bacterium]
MSERATDPTEAQEPADEVDASSAPLIEHLAELRTRLIRSVLAFFLAMCVFFVPAGGGDFLAEKVLYFVLQPICSILEANGQTCNLVFLAPQEYFFLLIRISLIFGFALAFPVIGFQLWRFVAPGLYRSERNAFLPFLLASPLLFLAGAAFTHYVVTPLAMQFLIGFADFAPQVADTVAGENAQGAPARTEPSITFQARMQDSLDLSLKFIFAFGLCFQLPVLLTLMGKAGLVSAAGLRNMRKYAVVAILTLAALITPPDVITQVILFSVVYALYELSILLVVRVEKKRDDALREQGLLDDDEEEEPA